MKPIKTKLLDLKKRTLFFKDLTKMDMMYFCRLCVIVLVLEICNNDARGIPSSSKNIFKELRGLCPSYIDNEVHSTHSQVPCFSSISNCKNDLDCLIGLKCCSDGCVKKCTPVITENEILANAYKPSVYTYNNSQDCEYKNTTIKHNATFINSECRTCRCLNTTINCISKTNGCPDKNLSSLKPLIVKMFIKGKR
ncbi:uncharacterized protein LOC100211405 isoform X1 [Hydra vulgaris]|uniref:uncharacterized protein LOC100211405 isoform X1 n=1 Tax=Hydra vulgaris TaxID=6087 RepID=UPI00064112A1|nr:uncharacterized protein LOC100211405 isoform X1 [Hydra vulgaris]